MKPIESLGQDDHAPGEPAGLAHAIERQDPGSLARMQQPLELILARHLAESLSVAVFLVDPDGNLVFYNEAAGEVLGMRYEETGELPLERWSTVFNPTQLDGRPLEADELPLVVALRERRPAHASFQVRGHDQVARQIHVTAIPIPGGDRGVVGAAAYFWEEDAS